MAERRPSHVAEHHPHHGADHRPHRTAGHRSTPASGADNPSGPGSTALVLAGHGSHLDPDSSAPVRDCADRLRDRWAGPVRTAFWKEEPSLRAVLRTVPADRAVVVPVMTSGGYFVDEVFPRELGLDEGRASSGPERPAPAVGADVTVAYTDPIGTHEALTDVVLQHAADVTDGAAPAPEFALALVGHGTERNENSAAATRRHAERLRERSEFREVRALFMDESPAVESLQDHVDAERVVVVPLFVANGYHVTEDIPADIGLPGDGERGWAVPATVDGTRIWYADAVGTNPSLVDVVAARAREGTATLDGEGTPDAETTSDATQDGECDPVSEARRAFRSWLHEGGDDAENVRQWGQLAIEVVDADRPEYTLRHVDDQDAASGALEIVADPVELGDRVRHDDRDRYRPLPGARTLPTGWRLPGLDADEAVRAVERVYPASVVDWYRERTGDLEPTHWAAAAGRQTGRYADVDDLDGAALSAAAEACCGDCVRRRTWEASDDERVDADPDDGPIPCREPCSVLIAAAREFIAVEDALEAGAPDDADRDAGNADRDAGNADRDVDHSVRPGAVNESGNVYRERYLATRRGDAFANPGGDEP